MTRLDDKGCAWDGLIIWFEAPIIKHRGIYMDREVAGRLADLFASHTDDAHAQECARQVREAIHQHDQYWRKAA